ncbi:hypothetical protein KDA_57290 [Dictyobacter alpinus]|uniref:Uncharacterized protein n=1 Tax=Dictyobacter alpinus TaxID=2014873 RepID=A0A402BFS8_9CHLR|nr:hypothetical protein KDA_57290 [Dictyobacter alpinus]
MTMSKVMVMPDKHDVVMQTTTHKKNGPDKMLRCTLSGPPALD